MHWPSYGEQPERTLAHRKAPICLCRQLNTTFRTGSNRLAEKKWFLSQAACENAQANNGGWRMPVCSPERLRTTSSNVQARRRTRSALLCRSLGDGQWLGSSSKFSGRPKATTRRQRRGRSPQHGRELDDQNGVHAIMLLQTLLAGKTQRDTAPEAV